MFVIKIGIKHEQEKQMEFLGPRQCKQCFWEWVSVSEDCRLIAAYDLKVYVWLQVKGAIFFNSFKGFKIFGGILDPNSKNCQVA